MKDKKVFFGPIAGLIEGAIMQPFDTVKNLRQSNQYQGLQHLKFSNLYKGFVPFTSQMSVKYFLRFYTFDKLKSKNDEYFKNFRAGVAAGLTESLFITPFELVKTNLQTTNNSKPISVINDIVKKNGFKGLYKGFFSTATRQTINQGFNFSTYYKLKTLFFDKNESPNPLKIAMCAMISSSIGPIISNPFDVVKTRYQNPKYNYISIKEAFSDIIYNEGIKKLWNGIYLRLFRVCGGQVITFYVIENLNYYVK